MKKKETIESGSEDEGPPPPADRGRNNNATTERCDWRDAEPGTSSKKDDEKQPDEEEVQFMKRFAIFMEKEGYIQRKEMPVAHGGMPLAQQAGLAVVRDDHRRVSEGNTHPRAVNAGKGIQQMGNPLNGTESEVTIYKRAVEMASQTGLDEEIDPEVTFQFPQCGCGKCFANK